MLEGEVVNKRPRLDDAEMRSQKDGQDALQVKENSDVFNSRFTTRGLASWSGPAIRREAEQPVVSDIELSAM